jgi:hypothetical protein
MGNAVAMLTTAVAAARRELRPLEKSLGQLEELLGRVPAAWRPRGTGRSGDREDQP